MKHIIAVFKGLKAAVSKWPLQEADNKHRTNRFRLECFVYLLQIETKTFQHTVEYCIICPFKCKYHHPMDLPFNLQFRKWSNGRKFVFAFPFLFFFIENFDENKTVQSRKKKKRIWKHIFLHLN